MDRLAKYLTNIREERPIKLIGFYNLVDSLDLTRPRRSYDIEARLVRGADYVVIFIEPELLSQLERLASSGSSRVEKSLQNNSHAAKVNGSFLLVRKGLSNPEVVMINKNGHYDSPHTVYIDVLVIENRQNFIDIDKTVSFLEKHSEW